MPNNGNMLEAIGGSALFEGMSPEEIDAVLHCVKAQKRSYAKNQTIIHQGTVASRMGLILSGGVRLEKQDRWGNRSILASLDPGQAFGEVYACLPGQPYDVNVVASQPATVLMMDMRRLSTPCSSACAFHIRLIQNVLRAMARRTRMLTRKLDHVSKRTTRGKLLSYLSDQAAGASGARFAIPFNRQELADYLGVDRSAMCAELSRMRKEGVIDYRKNEFSFIEPSL